MTLLAKRSPGSVGDLVWSEPDEVLEVDPAFAHRLLSLGDHDFTEVLPERVTFTETKDLDESEESDELGNHDPEPDTDEADEGSETPVRRGPGRPKKTE